MGSHKHLNFVPKKGHAIQALDILEWEDNTLSIESEKAPHAIIHEPLNLQVVC